MHPVAALSGAPPLPARLSAAAPLGLPSRPAPRYRQRLLGALRDRLALGLRHQRHDPHGEVVGLGQVDRGEADAAVAERQQKAALRDSRSSLAITSVAPVTLARCRARCSSGRVRVAAALHLGEVIARCCAGSLGWSMPNCPSAPSRCSPISVTTPPRVTIANSRLVTLTDDAVSVHWEEDVKCCPERQAAVMPPVTELWAPLTE